MISAGRDFTLLLSESNKIYGIGYNSDGRLGLGDLDGSWRP